MESDHKERKHNIHTAMVHNAPFGEGASSDAEGSRGESCIGSLDGISLRLIGYLHSITCDDGWQITSKVRWLKAAESHDYYSTEPFPEIAAACTCSRNALCRCRKFPSHFPYEYSILSSSSHQAAAGSECNRIQPRQISILPRNRSRTNLTHSCQMWHFKKFGKTPLQ